MSAAPTGPRLEVKIQRAHLVQTTSNGTSGWQAVGKVAGNHTLKFELIGPTGRPTKLVGRTQGHLEVGSNRHRVNLGGHPTPGGIGGPALAGLLDVLSVMRAWGTEVPCRLVLTDGGKTIVSNWTDLLRPSNPGRRRSIPIYSP